MQFLDDSLLPANQDKLVITVAPYGPEWAPSDFPEDIPLTMDQQVQKAVDCYNAGATVLHLPCRELDGHGSKRLSMFNEMIDRIRTAVPGMIIQVGGSISFAPESEEEGAEAKWLGVAADRGRLRCHALSLYFIGADRQSGRRGRRGGAGRAHGRPRRGGQSRLHPRIRDPRRPGRQ